MQEFYVTANGNTWEKYVAETLKDAQEKCAKENGFDNYRRMAMMAGLPRVVVAE